MRNIALTIAYEGTNYHGWQIQPNAVTVQEIVTKGLERILDHEVKTIGAARTDAGVHAMAQVVSCLTPKDIAPTNLLRGLNSVLPRDIRIREVSDREPDFHARYSAKGKVYTYAILNQDYNSPFLQRYALHFPYRLNLGAMKETLRLVLGEHDFSAFKKKDELYKNPVREVRRAGVGTRGGVVYVMMEATGFLRYMVRNIVGTLLLVGQEKLDKDDFRDIMESGEREKAGPTAPAHGLFLREVKY